MRFLITAGGTREYIDPVRYISNASSGRMGFALGRAALKAGHKVTLVAAPTEQKALESASLVEVESAAEMFAAVRKHFARCDCLIMAAAVADYTPARPAKTKIKRTGKALALRLKPTADILKWATSHKKKGQIVVGFALEDKALRSRAEKKMREKQLDMIVANTPAAIASAKSTVHIKTQHLPWVRMENSSKLAVARRIVQTVEKLSI